MCIGTAGPLKGLETSGLCIRVVCSPGIIQNMYRNTNTGHRVKAQDLSSDYLSMAICYHGRHGSAHMAMAIHTLLYCAYTRCTSDRSQTPYLSRAL